MKTNLHTPEDFQALRLALRALDYDFYVARMSPYSEAAKRTYLKDGAVVIPAIDKNNTVNKWEVLFNYEGVIDVGEPNNVGIIGHNHPTEKQLISYLRHIVDSMKKAGFAEEEPFWPVIMTESRSILSIHHSSADPLSVLTSYFNRANFVNPKSCHRAYQYGEGRWNSLFFRTDSEYVNIHPFTVKMLSTTADRIESSHDELPYSDDPLVIEMHRVLFNTIRNLSYTLDSSKCRSYEIHDAHAVAHSNVCWAIDRNRALLSKPEFKSNVEKSILENIKPVYPFFEAAKEALINMFKTKDWDTVLEAVKIIVEDKALPDIKYLFPYLIHTENEL